MVAVVALLLGLSLPSLAGARDYARAVACASNARQIAIATELYRKDWRDALPQTMLSPVGGTPIARATAVAGTRAQTPALGLRDLGPLDRPLNPYLIELPADRDAAIEVPVCRSPCDRGAMDLQTGFPEFDRTDSLYRTLGTSYAINDHDLDGDAHDTLIPSVGGRMPQVRRTDRTWLVGSAPIYNFQQDTDRGQYWYDPKVAMANLVFVDLHARIKVPIPNELCVVENETEHYQFHP